MRVLLVDDNAAVRAGARIVLRREYEVTEARTGEAALELLESQEFDVVVCDREMPGISGIEVWSRLSPEMQGRFVLWTGAPDGVCDGIRVLNKPASVAELEGAVEEAARSQEYKT